MTDADLKRADTPDKLDYDWLALVVDRLGVALSDLAGDIRRRR